MVDLPDPVPLADSYEQELPAAPVLVEGESPVTVTIAGEVPEADALEQALPGPELDEDDAPR